MTRRNTRKRKRYYLRTKGGVAKVLLITMIGDGPSNELPVIVLVYSNRREMETQNRGDTITTDSLLTTTVDLGLVGYRGACPVVLEERIGYIEFSPDELL